MACYNAINCCCSPIHHASYNTATTGGRQTILLCEPTNTVLAHQKTKEDFTNELAVHDMARGLTLYVLERVTDSKAQGSFRRGFHLLQRT